MATSEPDYGAELPSPAVLRRLKISPEVGWYLSSRGIPLPDSPPLHKTPEPRRVAGAVFDADRVDKVLRVFHQLRHTIGRLAGQPLDPDPWQIAYILAPVFGWIHRDDDGYWVRIITQLYVEVSRKNGKSTLSGGIAIYLTCSDGEEGAQVIAAATTKEQAGFVFAPVKKLAESAPALKGKVKATATAIVHPRTGSVFKAVSSVGDAQMGANLHGGIIDELHVHKSPELVEAIETSTGSRSQPLIVTITTADEGKPNTIYARRRERIEQLARRVFTDPSTYGVIWGASEKDDPFIESTWRKANPGFPVSPTRRYMESEANKARNSPAELATFQRLHLGIRTKQKTRFVLLRDWDRNAGTSRLWHDPEFRDHEAYGGLDLASVSDITSLCWLLPRDEIRDGSRVTSWRALWHNWIPDAAVPALDKRTADAASLWVKQGWLTVTEGDVTDYEAVYRQIAGDPDDPTENGDLGFYDVESIGFDPWNATDLTNRLTAAGAPMVQVRQGFATMSAPVKQIQRLVMLGRRAAPMLENGGNPVARWAVDNLAVATDAAGNVKPDKDNSGDKIDPFAALATAMSEALGREKRARSAYEDEGVVFI